MYFDNEENPVNKFVCVPPTSRVSNTAGNSAKILEKISHAQVATNQLWGKDALYVFFLNPDDLQLKFSLNVQNIISWANNWRRDDAIPNFELTEVVGKASIRVVVSKLIIKLISD